MRPIDCGIDIGSTNLKVVLVTDEGEVLSVRTVPSPRVDDGVGPATDAVALVGLLEDLILESWNSVALGQPLRSITTVGVGEDGIGITEDFTPTGLSLPWFDIRARGEAEELAQRFDHADRAGIAIGPDRTAAKWLWIHRNRPDELAAARTWIALTDFPAAYWTGQAFMSASLAPRTACYDVYRRTWISDLLAACHAPGMPPILGAGTALGPVRRGRLLESGAVTDRTVVAVGGHDHPVAASVIRALDAEALVDSLGTANLLYGETSRTTPGAKTAGLAISVPPTGTEALALLGVLEFSAALEASGATKDEIRRFLSSDNLAGEPPSNLSELMEDSPTPEARLRRNIERECLRARALAGRMAGLGVSRRAIYSTGGWSRSRGFMALRSSVFGQPLKILDDLELSALGAAQYGGKAATGRLTCLISTDDIKVVDPVDTWVQSYDALAREAGRETTG